jgi:multisubunit Na+/H+ antiporter MnhG subunit
MTLPEALLLISLLAGLGLLRLSDDRHRLPAPDALSVFHLLFGLPVLVLLLAALVAPRWEDDVIERHII